MWDSGIAVAGEEVNHLKNCKVATQQIEEKIKWSGNCKTDQISKRIVESIQIIWTDLRNSNGRAADDETYLEFHFWSKRAVGELERET